MAIIDDIKCPRCDRKYSGVRSRCPYCGARRIGFGKYSKESDNARGKMLISVLILAVFTVAAGIMLFSTPADADNSLAVSPTPDTSLEDDILTLQNQNTPEPTPEPDTPTPPPQVTYVEILYDGRELSTPNSFTRWIDPGHANGGPLPGFTVHVEPPSVDTGVDIYSEDESIFYIEQISEGAPYRFTVYPVSAGDAKLIATCGDKSHTVHVSIPG